MGWQGCQRSLATEQDLRQVLIDMIPISQQANAEGGELMRSLYKALERVR